MEVASERSDPSRTILLVVGGALVLFGIYALAERAGLISAWIPEWVRLNWSQLRTGVGLIVVGGLVIWVARGGFKAPAAGTRLYRTREDKWLAGVLGGLARYFGVDATMLRLLFLALAVLGEGWVIGPYILMAILVPKEPVGTTAVTSSGPPIEIQVPPAPPAPAPPVPEPPAPAATPADASAQAVPPVEAGGTSPDTPPSQP